MITRVVFYDDEAETSNTIELKSDGPHTNWKYDRCVPKDGGGYTVVKEGGVVFNQPDGLEVVKTVLTSLEKL